MKIVSLVGARPQFVKEAMLGKAVRESQAWQHVLVHSGQHYDINMSDIFFQELGIPQPDYHLGIGSGSHATMTAAAMVGMEEVLLKDLHRLKKEQLTNLQLTLLTGLVQTKKYLSADATIPLVASY